jgi:hypothetical protein
MVYDAGAGENNYVVHNPNHPEGPKDYEVTVLKTSVLRCRCSAFIAAGKECQHTFAVRLYRALGSYEEFSERQYKQDTQGRYADNRQRQSSPNSIELESWDMSKGYISPDNCNSDWTEDESENVLQS